MMINKDYKLRIEWALGQGNSEERMVQEKTAARSYLV